MLLRYLLHLESSEEWGLPVELISPIDGSKQTLKKNSTDKLTGQVFYNRVEFNPNTGEEISIDDPGVVLRLNSLDIIPNDGENWSVKIPITPDEEDTLVTFILSPTKAMKFNRSLGIVTMYLQKATQS